MLPTLESIEGVDMSLVTETLTPLNLALSIVSCVSSVGAGIAGIRGQIQEKSGDLHRTLFPADSDISDPDGGDRVV